MRTPLSERLLRGLTGSLEKGGAVVAESTTAMGLWAGAEAPEHAEHYEVQGNEADVLRFAAGLGRDAEQDAVAVAIHDMKGPGRVFVAGVNDGALQEALTRFVAAGLSGATGLLDRLSVVVFAADEAESDLAEGVVDAHMGDADGFVSAGSRPARTLLVRADEYDRLLGAEPGGGEVTAEVIVGGVRGQ